MSAISAKLARPGVTTSLPSVEIDGRRFAWADCTPLHRTVEQDIAEWLLLSPEGDFLTVEMFGTNGHHSLRRLAPAAARRYLIERGEGDMVDDFPALFAANASADA